LLLLHLPQDFRGGGYAINLGADANTLEVEGKENLSVYNAKLYDRGEVPASEAERNFCRFCGSFLWLYDPRWPLRLGDRHTPPQTSRARPPDAELRANVVRDPHRRRREPFS
jgi:hypothetical protein